MTGIDPNPVFTATNTGNIFYSNAWRRRDMSPPTPAQIAQRERDEWNAKVEARKVAKKGIKP